MALKRKLSKEEFEKLSEVLKSEYKEKDGSYVIDLDGDGEDVGAALRARDHEKEARKIAEDKVKELQKQMDQSKDDSLRSKGDVDALDKSWTAKLETTKSEYEAKLEKQNSFIKSALVDNVAIGLANKLSKSPSLLIPIIKSRLKADFEGEKPTTKILDANGNLSALTISDLEKEIMTNDEFKPILIGSKASGSGASGGNQIGSGNSGANQEPKKPDLASLSPKALKEYMANKNQTQE